MRQFLHLVQTLCYRLLQAVVCTFGVYLGVRLLMALGAFR